MAQSQQQHDELYQREVKDAMTCIHHYTKAMKQFPLYDVEEYKREDSENIVDYMQRIVSELWYNVAILGEVYEIASDTDTIMMTPLQYQRTTVESSSRTDYMHGVEQLEDIVEDERFSKDYITFVPDADNSLDDFLAVWDTLKPKRSY